MNLYIVNTPYHLLLATLKNKKNDRIIVIDSFKIRYSKYSKKLLARYFDEGEIFILEPLKKYGKKLFMLPSYIRKIKHDLKKNKFTSFDKIYLFNDVDPLCQLIINHVDYRCEVILIEEGIGLYRDIIKQNRWMYKLFGKLIFGKGFEDINRIGEYSKVDAIECNYPKFLSEKQLQKRIDEMNRINISSNIIGMESIMEDGYYDLFIGQPLPEDNVMDESEYINTIDNLLNFVPVNCLLAIKPHPRENLEKYKKIKNNRFRILEDYDVPVELVIANSRIKNVYTLYSSSAMNISRYLNINVFMLYKIANLHLEIPSELFTLSGVKIIGKLEELNGRDVTR